MSALQRYSFIHSHNNELTPTVRCHQVRSFVMQKSKFCINLATQGSRSPGAPSSGHWKSLYDVLDKIQHTDIRTAILS